METSTWLLNHLSAHAALISIFNKTCSNFVLDLRVSISYGMTTLKRRLSFKLKWQIYLIYIRVLLQTYLKKIYILYIYITQLLYTILSKI